jgi:D-alanyl-lipoteichoic acid acyltransferase DltB (MBOAT superfamily)
LALLFNSCTFVTFLVVVTIAYFLMPPRSRWALMLVASCAFYMFFVPVYILILLVTIGIDYLAGIWIEDSRSPRVKRTLLVASASSVCISLFIFKYFNFFNANLGVLAAALHWNYPIKALRIVLPIGLSFHTFQSLSYVIEVYRGRQKAERHLGIYALYVMYFPQLVAGPIERPQHLLHQFHEPQPFSASRLWDGLSLALWGLFKKVVVADALAIYVGAVYPSHRYQSGASLLLATYFFAIQIYCDFSGYSDIARGVSRIYGVELMRNFNTPYFATTISEFWSRWHISLSTWFRDYVYIPLGGNRVSVSRNVFNLFVVFLLSGFWHGANWTFIVWGALHAIYLIGERLLGRSPAEQRLSRPERASSLLRGLLTFHLVLVGWIFFRASDVTSAFHILGKVAVPRGPLLWDAILIQSALGIAVVAFVDFFTGPSNYWDNVRRSSLALRFAYSLTMLFAIVLFGIEQGAQFIYFQF